MAVTVRDVEGLEERLLEAGRELRDSSSSLLADARRGGTKTKLSRKAFSIDRPSRTSVRSPDHRRMRRFAYWRPAP